ncbi:MAG: hypothetical protein LUG51_16285 [Tannerellaceae bacterium]|nr:hypothetical protein [Tannerellaceae bacterium]
MSKIISVLNDLLDWNLPRIPCANTISSWIQKSGYKIYKDPQIKNSEDEYALIFDESMLVGSERLLLTLGLKAHKENSLAIAMQDVQVLDISVREKWDSDSITQVVEKTLCEFSSRPSYILSDNDTKLKKAIRLLDCEHVPDVGHTLALCLEKTYKEEADFKEYMKKLSALRFKYIMTPVAYLLPPSQRTIARFMNLRDVIKWSSRIKENMYKLGPDKEIFLFIGEYSSLIDELQESFNVVDQINHRLKKDGLNNKILTQEQQRLRLHLKGKTDRQRKLASLIEDYLSMQKPKFSQNKQPLHISSDIVESLFSVYKRRKAANPLYGVTQSILLLPLLTKKTTMKSKDFKQALQEVSLEDIKRWKEKTLSINQAHKRNRILAA